MLYVKIKIVATVALFAVIGINEIQDNTIGPVVYGDPVWVASGPVTPGSDDPVISLPIVVSYPTIVHPDVIASKVPATEDAPVQPVTKLAQLVNGVNAEQHRCLALNIYHEARGEQIDGQIAVANVTMNRVNNRRYPDTVCKVVLQKVCGKKLRYTAAYDGCTPQFTWTWDGASDTPKNKEAWLLAQVIAAKALTGKLKNMVRDAVLYHSTRVNPYWAKKMLMITQIDDHIFYAQK